MGTYKVMGMEMKNKARRYVMPDDPAFGRIYQDVAVHNHTVMAHIAEPNSCLQPPNPASRDYSYYKERPQEYAYLHAQWPTNATIFAAHEHIVAENPNLRVVGEHLWSMGADVNQLVQRFDRYPSFSVDTAAHGPYLIMQPHAKVRAFLNKYQDLVIYGWDLDLMPKASITKTLQQWRQEYLRDWKYFATNYREINHGKKFQGPKRPQSILRKIFHDNAVHWFPGIAPDW